MFYINVGMPLHLKIKTGLGTELKKLVKPRGEGCHLCQEASDEAPAPPAGGPGKNSHLTSPNCSTLGCLEGSDSTLTSGLVRSGDEIAHVRARHTVGSPWTLATGRPTSHTGRSSDQKL